MINYKPFIQEFNYKEQQVSVLRLDLIDPEISGNKWFKLKYNLEQAQKEGKDTIITFGGAFSNHIAATAAACKLTNFKCIGIIRGEEKSICNLTLSKAKQYGMDFQFVSRKDYQSRNNKEYVQALQLKFPNSYIIPEGGDNDLGQKGCREILNSKMSLFTSIFCAYGTGTTFKGILKSLLPNQHLYGVNVLKYDAITEYKNATIINSYHFGGYAKHNMELINFKEWFEETYCIPLDYVYTVKLFFSVIEMLNKNMFKDEKILIVHSGGLQGNIGYEERYNLKPMRHVNDAQGKNTEE